MSNDAMDRLTNRKVDELKCDICGKHLGWVYEFDLEENYFYCDGCKEEVKREQ